MKKINYSRLGGVIFGLTVITIITILLSELIINNNISNNSKYGFIYEENNQISYIQFIKDEDNYISGNFYCFFDDSKSKKLNISGSIIDNNINFYIENLDTMSGTLKNNNLYLDYYSDGNIKIVEYKKGTIEDYNKKVSKIKREIANNKRIEELRIEVSNIEDQINQNIKDIKYEYEWSIKIDDNYLDDFYSYLKDVKNSYADYINNKSDDQYLGYLEATTDTLYYQLNFIYDDLEAQEKGIETIDNYIIESKELIWDYKDKIQILNINYDLQAQEKQLKKYDEKCIKNKTKLENFFNLAQKEADNYKNFKN
jgi:hypothetical protein